jgi:mRNA interferase MazF
VKRGDVVVVAVPGDYGKPRPAVVVQSDLFNDTHASLSIAPITSTLVNAPLFRVTLEPSPANGLRSISQVMVDKLTAVKRDRINKVVGRIDDETMLRLSRAIALWFGIAS